MLLSRSAEYALRATHYLAFSGAGERVPASDLAATLGLPENYLSKLLYRLQQEGLLDSRRGPRGGFRLAREPSEVTLAEVVRPFDDIGDRTACLLGRPECRDDTPCAAHEDWKEVAERVRSFFTGTRLSDLTRSLPEGASSAGEASVRGGAEDAEPGGAGDADSGSPVHPAGRS